MWVNNIRQVRCNLGLAPGQFAKALQMSVDELLELEAGRSRLNVPICFKIIALGKRYGADLKIIDLHMKEKQYNW